MDSEDGMPVKDPLPGPGGAAGTMPGCKPTVQPRLEGARAVSACASLLGAGQAPFKKPEKIGFHKISLEMTRPQ